MDHRRRKVELKGRCRCEGTKSAPFPQLLPRLDEDLHLFGSRQSVIDQPTIPIGPVIEIPDSFDAQMSEVVTEFFKVLLAQDFAFATIGTPRHKATILASSLYVRLRLFLWLGARVQRR
jgi:hypothetical protein